MKKHIQKASKNTKVRFAAIGVVNTAIDFTILNLLAHGIGLPRIPSNIISASTAMIFSFFANRTVVFNAKTGRKREQAVKFLVVTAFGIYIIQNLVILISVEMMHGFANADLFGGLFENDVIVTNLAKVAATGASLVWNYLMYEKVVFADGKKP